MIRIVFFAIEFTMSEDGAITIECGLALAVIAIVCVMTVGTIGRTAQSDLVDGHTTSTP